MNAYVPAEHDNILLDLFWLLLDRTLLSRRVLIVHEYYVCG